MLILLLPNLLLGTKYFLIQTLQSCLSCFLIFFSLQIIATRNHPCCECVKYSDNRTPVCLLFLIFLVCSSVVITGVMYYLKSGIKYCRFCWIHILKMHFLKSIDSSTIVKIPAVTNVNDLNAQSTRKSFCLLLMIMKKQFGLNFNIGMGVRISRIVTNFEQF